MSSDPDGILLLITPPPTPNGPLHLGHLFGPYVAGDVAARAARARGRAVLTQCGLDAHQNYVLARAEALGRPPIEVAEHYEDLIRRGFAGAGIQYDILADPLADAQYRTGVARLFSELVDAKVVEVGATWLGQCASCNRILHHARVGGSCPECGAGAAGGTCEGCGSFLTALTLAGARSTCCAADVRAVERTVPVLRLEQHRDALCRFWARALLPPRLRHLIGRYLDRGLPDVPLAYPSDWGIAWDHDGERLRIDVWAEMAVANMYLPARHLGGEVDGIADAVHAWSAIGEQWLFMGMDNAFYYAIMIPALHLAAGLPSGPTGCVVNEFYRLDGAKFSTSRNHAIWAHEFLAEHDAGAVRAFGCWDRPDSYESDFTSARYAAFRSLYEGAMRGEGSKDLPGDLADAELLRGQRALLPQHFDPATAVRAALATVTTRPAESAALLSLLAGAS